MREVRAKTTLPWLPWLSALGLAGAGLALAFTHDWPIGILGFVELTLFGYVACPYWPTVAMRRLRRVRQPPGR